MPGCEIARIDVSPYLLTGDVIEIAGCEWRYLYPTKSPHFLSAMLSGSRNLVGYEAWRRNMMDVYREYKDRVYGSPEEEIRDFCRVFGYGYAIWVTDSNSPRYDIILLPRTREEYERLIRMLRHPRLLALKEAGRTLVDVLKWKLGLARRWYEEIE